MSADFGNDFPCCAHQPQAPGHATDEATWKFLERVNALHPDQFKVGQEHLPPAFREIDYRLAFTTLAEMVNEFEQTFGAARAAAVAPREDERGVEKFDRLTHGRYNPDWVDDSCPEGPFAPTPRETKD